MKYIAAALFLSFAFAMPGSAKSAERTGYRIISFSDAMKKAMNDGSHWKACGAYFAAANSTEGKIVYFTFEKRVAGKSSRIPAFSMTERVVVSIDERLWTPMLVVRGTTTWDVQFVLKMNTRDYKASLPCLANGTTI